MPILDRLDWARVREHYELRHDIHRKLLRLHDAGEQDALASLMLGVSDPAANYSAGEYGLGRRILAENPDAGSRVFDLAGAFRVATAAREVPKRIRAAQLAYLGIAVGSEASCLMNPGVCWVSNTRTIWTHLVVKHADDLGKANEELSLYKDGDSTSEMAYAKWREIHRLLETSMTRISKEGAGLARKAGVEPGDHAYLWADAIASQMYAEHR